VTDSDPWTTDMDLAEADTEDTGLAAPVAAACGALAVVCAALVAVWWVLG
jgi:hypothetical protein